MRAEKLVLSPKNQRKVFFIAFKRAYNVREFAKSNSGFSRPFNQGVERTPSSLYDLGVFLYPSQYGDRTLGGLMPCRFLGYGLLTRFPVTSMFLAGQEVTPIKSRRSLMGNYIQSLPYSVNAHQKQVLNKLLGRKRFNRDVLAELQKHDFISQITVRTVNEGWVVDLLAIDQQTATLKTLDGSKDKVFKSLDTVNEFLSELGLSGYVVASENKEVAHV